MGYTSDITDSHILADLCRDKDAVIACLPYHLILGVVQVARQLGIHYFDLTEDVATTRAIRTLAASADAVMIPQNGLAPGLIGMLGSYLVQQFEPGTLRHTQRGFVKQEDIPLLAFLNTTTGHLFAEHHPALRTL